MNANARYWIAALLLLSGSQAAQAQQSEDYLNAPDRVQWEAGALYDGRFDDDGTPFRIVLAYPRPKAVPKEVAGGFVQMLWHPRDYAGEPSGLLKAGGAGPQMRLTVVNGKGVAGDVHYTVTLSDDRASGRGVWTGQGTLGQRAFTLQRALPYLGVVVKRPVRAELADKPYYRERGFVFSSFFPVTGNPQADGWIREQAGACVEVGTCANMVQVLWQSRALLSLRATVWGDSGGVHGDGQSYTQQYGVAHRTMTPLGLDAFIDPGKRCREQVSAAIVAQLNAKAMSWADKAGLDARRANMFTPTPGGLAFHYDPYEAGPYAEGAPTVFVTRNMMGNCVVHLPTDE